MTSLTQTRYGSRSRRQGKSRRLRSNQVSSRRRSEESSLASSDMVRWRSGGGDELVPEFITTPPQVRSLTGPSHVFPQNGVGRGRRARQWCGGLFGVGLLSADRGHVKDGSASGMSAGGSGSGGATSVPPHKSAKFFPSSFGASAGFARPPGGSGV